MTYTLLSPFSWLLAWYHAQDCLLVTFSFSYKTYDTLQIFLRFLRNPIVFTIGFIKEPDAVSHAC
jgi:fumarate reductase subunit C